MEDNKKEIEFLKLNLKQDDILIIKVDTSEMTPDEATDKLSSVRDDDFVNYIKDRGNPVLVAYSGLDFEILRLDEKDKVVVYMDVSSMDDDKAKNYEDYIKFKLNETLGDKLIPIQVRNGSPVLKVSKGEKE
jgi:hypothetical protein